MYCFLWTLKTYVHVHLHLLYFSRNTVVQPVLWLPFFLDQLKTKIPISIFHIPYYAVEFHTSTAIESDANHWYQPTQQVLASVSSSALFITLEYLKHTIPSFTPFISEIQGFPVRVSECGCFLSILCQIWWDWSVEFQLATHIRIWDGDGIQSLDGHVMATWYM